MVRAYARRAAAALPALGPATKRQGSARIKARVDSGPSGPAPAKRPAPPVMGTAPAAPPDASPGSGGQVTNGPTPDEPAPTDSAGPGTAAAGADRAQPPTMSQPPGPDRAAATPVEPPPAQPSSVWLLDPPADARPADRSVAAAGESVWLLEPPAANPVAPRAGNPSPDDTASGLPSSGSPVPTSPSASSSPVPTSPSASSSSPPGEPIAAGAAVLSAEHFWPTDDPASGQPVTLSADPGPPRHADPAPAGPTESGGNPADGPVAPAAPANPLTA